MTKLSNLISSLRSIVFFIIAIIILPIFLKETGVWLSLPTADFMCFTFSCILLKKDILLLFKRNR